jgi:hypothetical protein
LPLGPLVRVPAFVSACVVVFCLAFVAADADAQAPDCSSMTSPSDLQYLCLVNLDQLDGANVKLGAIKDALYSGSVPWLSDVDSTLGDISYDLAEFRQENRTRLDDVIGSNFGGLQKLNNQLGNLYDSSIDSGITNPSQNQPGWLTLHDDLVIVHDDLRDVVDAVDAQGPNGGGVGGPTGDDADPVRVQLASSETQLEDAANAGLGALWFLAGLLVVVVVAGAIRKALMPS